ncbi:DUF4159 domain-containing protein [Litorivita sp. NS0012-18]|uniref:DUF4159 domain-containing protein n=1 Tax=Litorivita sp. NS0012-18 TaxID=3127655 RepID=UPI00310500A7
MIGPVGFAAPWLLAALVALPVLWLILRAVPPAPTRRRFPGVALLLGLKDADSVADRTPWWLMLLRMLAVAAVIIGLAGPVLNPRAQEGAPSRAPLLVVLDASWASAAQWRAQSLLLEDILDEAARAGRRAAYLRLTDAGEAPRFAPAAEVARGIGNMAPLPWQAGEDDIKAALARLPEGTFDSIWMSDGLARGGRADMVAALGARGALRVYQSAQPVLGMTPAAPEGAALSLRALRSDASSGAREVSVAVHGLDPAGNPQILARVPMQFAAGAQEAVAELSLPAELRARLTRFEIEGVRSAGAVALSDDSLHRREIAIIGGGRAREGMELLSPRHYLDRALEPSADMIEGDLADILPANPDVIILADVATLAPAEAAQLTEWVERGGLLLRFAGPRLASSDVSRAREDALMPVRLRAGGRSVGGAMSWGEPKTLAPFAADSPFAGLVIPAEVTVSAQVLAQPDPDLAARVIAALSDGTPLVTRKSMGAGQVVLFHVTANAEWSTLPLTGLFVEMLERLAVLSAMAAPQAETLAGSTWQPVQVLDAFGRIAAAGTLAGVDGADLMQAPLGRDLRPGLYEGEGRRIARSVLDREAALAPAVWPASVAVTGLERRPAVLLGGWLLALALVALAADVAASLALSGRLFSARAKTASGVKAAVLAGVLALTAFGAPQSGQAQDSNDMAAIDASAEIVLAHVITGDAGIDATARAGLLGLSETLYFRTSVEPATPKGVDLERDELAFYPLLYWPVTPQQPQPSDAAYARLNRYLRAGGMILFDTRDADIARYGSASPAGRKLQQLAAPLDIPPLEPLPADHVLTRAFYLLQDFPGRWLSREVWVEAAPADAEKIEGMPFRNLNDGVSPVVIGGNDWAAAWAVGENGQPLYPVGRGFAGERQRELAHRFGVNLVMYVLTGNYKSDQVHVPALLDRLGQ